MNLTHLINGHSWHEIKQGEVFKYFDKIQNFMNNFLLLKFQEELVAEVRKAVACVWEFQVCVCVYTNSCVCAKFSSAEVGSNDQMW